jgi:hypothetical protein
VYQNALLPSNRSTLFQHLAMSGRQLRDRAPALKETPVQKRPRTETEKETERNLRPRKRQRTTEKRPRTDLAKIYGHPTGSDGYPDYNDHSVLKKIVPLKSGLTPIDFLQFDLENSARYRNLINYQRLRFKGFIALLILLCSGNLTISQGLRRLSYKSTRH